MLLAVALEIITILVSESFCLHIYIIIMVGYNTNFETNHFIDKSFINFHKLKVGVYKPKLS